MGGKIGLDESRDEAFEKALKESGMLEESSTKI